MNTHTKQLQFLHCAGCDGNGKQHKCLTVPLFRNRKLATRKTLVEKEILSQRPSMPPYGRELRAKHGSGLTLGPRARVAALLA